MDIQIRKAQIEDVNEIISLNQQLFDYDSKFDNTLDKTWPQKNKDYFEKSITDDNFLAFVAVADDKIMGYLIGSITKAEDYRNIKDIAELENMFILSNHRKKGIGTLLVNKFVDWAKEKGMKRIKVFASADNQLAINFYKKNYFKDYGITLEKEL